MAIRIRTSDNSRGSGGCTACGAIATDVISGDLRVQSTLTALPGRPDWPLLGGLYRSTDTSDGALGVGRRAAGLLGMKVLGPNNTSTVNVVDEQGQLAYYTYSGGTYTNASGGRNVLYRSGTGWLEVRPCGSYFQYNSAKRLIATFDTWANAVYFGYDGSGHYQKAVDHRSGLAVYFETDASGRVTEVKDWGGRETTLSYAAGHQLDKIVGPSLCVTYFDYVSGNLSALKDPEGRTLQFTYDGSRRVTREIYAGATTYFNYGSDETAVVDALGEATYYGYDGTLIVSVKDPLGDETEHDDWYSDTDATGLTTYYTYDTNGRITYTGTADGYGTYYQRDAQWTEFMSAQGDALGNTTYYGYDAHGSRSSIVDPLGHASYYTYNAWG